MTSLYFDHSFTEDAKHRFHKKLGSMGFRLMESEVEHPGKHFCRFIMFSSRSKTKRSYLEFVDARSKKHPIPRAGFSFGYPDDLERFYHSIKKSVNCHFVHKNYNWKEDSTSRLPGWNFLNFKDSGIRSYMPWVTEYETYPKAPKRPMPEDHKNTAYRILGFEFLVSPKSSLFYKKVLGQSPVGEVSLSCKTKINFSASASNRIVSVIIACRDLDKFHKVARPKTYVDYNGKEAAYIQNPMGGWDILVVEA